MELFGFWIKLSCFKILGLNVVICLFTVIPRILFDNWQTTDLKAFFTEPTSISEQSALIEQIKKTCKQWKFDGVVLEVISQIGKYADRSVKFIQQFGIYSTFLFPIYNMKMYNLFNH